MLRYWKGSDGLWLTVGLARDAWLIGGLAILLFTGLDLLYRGEVALRSEVRRLVARPHGPVHPYHSAEWWRDFDRNVPERADPYRSWWALPYSSRYVHVDSAGHRETLNVAAASTPGPTVFMLGGSVMWGYTARDSATIPSLVAARLAAAGIGPMHVVNLAQPAYNTTQELITLLLELRRGNVPAIAVFLDGSNDVLAAYQQERGGAIFGQHELAHDSGFGWRWLWAQGLEFVRDTRLGDRWMRAVWAWKASRVTRSNRVSDCKDVAAYYRQTVLSAAGLGRQWNFPVVYLWQPSWATTGKRLTPWEAAIKGEGQFPSLMRRCTDLVDSLMQDRSGKTFVSLTSIFDRDTASVFLDEYGHITEAGNGEIADRITSLVAPLLANRCGTCQVAEPELVGSITPSNGRESSPRTARHGRGTGDAN
jgi:hypothetical protein